MKSRNRIKDAKLSQKGQITIPKEVREKLGIDAGDRIVFYFDDNEEVKISSADNTEIWIVNSLLDKLNVDRFILHRS